MSNLFVRFKKLLGTQPQRVGVVVVVDGAMVVVEESGGGQSRILGSATMGQSVYFTGDKMDGLAPSLPTVLVEE